MVLLIRLSENTSKYYPVPLGEIMGDAVYAFDYIVDYNVVTIAIA